MGGERRLITWILVITLIANPIFLARAETPQADVPSEFQQLSVELEAAGPGDFPSRPQKDAFSLLRQKIRVVRNDSVKTYDTINPPDIPGIGNFDNEVAVEFDSNTKTLSFVLKGKITIYHDFENMDVLAFERDREILTIVERSGQAWAIDTGLAASLAFRGPLPMIQLLKISPHLLEGKIKASYLTRGVKPRAIRSDALLPLGAEQKSVLTAGDLAIYNEHELVALLDRDVIRNQLYTSELVLSILATVITPNSENLKIISDVTKEQPLVFPAALKNKKDLSDLEKEVLGSISPEKLQALLSRGLVNNSAWGERRDKFTIEQWQTKDLANHWNRLKSEPPDRRIKNKLFKNLTSKALKLFTVILAGTGAVLAAQGLIDGNGPAWAVRAVNDLYVNYWPEVLKDSVYRVTLLKSSLLMASFVPAVYVMGALAGRVLFPGWSAQKAQAKIGMILYGLMSRPFFHYLADLARQPNFITAMQKGINPFKKIKTAEGETFRAGWVNPILTGEKKSEQVNKHRDVLNQLANSARKKETLAYALAAMTFAAEAGTDPATLLLLASQNGFDSTNFEKLKTPESQSQWYRIARELVGELEDLASLRGQNQDLLTREQLSEAFLIASRTAEKINRIENSRFKTLLLDFKHAWQQLGSRTLRGIGNYSVEEGKFLFKAEPSDMVANQYWRQFMIDFELTVAQMGIFGARSDLTAPADLAADASGPLYTNRGYLVDLLEDLKIDNVIIPATLALVFQKAAVIRDHSYAPIQEHLLKGENKSDSFLRGMWTWMKAASNLQQAGYGAIYVRELVKSLKTIQAIFVFSVASRIFIGDQSLSVAILATTYVWIWYRWQYNWPWPIISRGNEVYENQTENKRREFMNLKTDLDQAIKLGDRTSEVKAYSGLMSFAKREGSELPKNLKSQELLDYVLKHPVVASQANPKVLRATTAVGSVLTTYLASGLFADSFRHYALTEWFGKIGEVGAWSAAIYSGLYLGEKYLLPKIIDQAKKINQTIKSFKNNDSALGCRRILDLQ